MRKLLVRLPAGTMRVTIRGHVLNRIRNIRKAFVSFSIPCELRTETKRIIFTLSGYLSVLTRTSEDSASVRDFPNPSLCEANCIKNLPRFNTLLPLGGFRNIADDGSHLGKSTTADSAPCSIITAVKRARASGKPGNPVLFVNS